jgi:hypothetical protein
MTIAIHHNKSSFSTRWIQYCEQNNIAFKIVDCYSTSIVKDVEDCDALMWHHNHADPKDVVFARQLLASLQMVGKAVFPNHETAWHFDDKVGQKYLLEAINAPVVPSYVYYSAGSALKAVSKGTFPIVFKLRGGAGSRNVMLIKNLSEAKRMIKKSFGKGFRQYDAIGGIKEQIRKFRIGKAKAKDIAKAVAHIVYPIQLERSKGREAGYFYFQEFLPDNTFDLRVVIIGDKAFGLKRMVRENDFRASGSGYIIYDHTQMDINCVKISFDVYNKLQKAQCIAFDYVYDKDKNPLIVEISYGFAPKAYDACPGYWKSNLEFVEGKFDPFGLMVEEVIKEVKQNKTVAAPGFSV